MNIYVILYYLTAKDMEWPEGTEPREAYYCPDGMYSNLGNNRTIPLYNPDNLKNGRVEADTILDAYYKFIIKQPTVIVVGIENERVDNPSIAGA